MSIEIKHFKPYEYATIPATTTSANVAFATAVGDTLRIHNLGTSTVYVQWGLSSQTATSSTGIPVGIAPASREFVYTGGINNVAAIAAAGSSAVHVTRGDGLAGN